ncbi:hypothetical protein MMC30_004981 [Trapelia coarctata]|nr:hypothetical protein [Trapelia coarctata]
MVTTTTKDTTKEIAPTEAETQDSTQPNMVTDVEQREPYTGSAAGRGSSDENDRRKQPSETFQSVQAPPYPIRLSENGPRQDSIGESSSEEVCEGYSLQSDIIRSIPKPQYPIRVCEEGPHSMRPEMRRHWLKTTVMLWESDKDEWRTEPDIKVIAEILAPTLEHLGIDASTTIVSELCSGGFNRVFTVAASEKDSSASREFVFRVPLPIYPYYKTECEVATMEIARCSTSIRLPIVYAYDSSTNNKLGLEWILMEKIQGESLIEKWHDFSDATLADLTVQMADWQNELRSTTSTNIGGIYMRWGVEQLEFFVGPSVDLAFSRNRAFYYDIPRGPFESISDYYNARLMAAEQELMDPLYLLLWEGKRQPSERLHPDQQAVIESLVPKKEEVLTSELHEDDRMNNERSGPQRRWIEESLQAVRTLKSALSILSPTCPVLAKTTLLGHDDLGARNIMVDADGNITGLLDWEYLDLQSLLFMKLKPYPEFLGSDEQEEEKVDGGIEMMSDSEDEDEDQLAERLKTERYENVTANLRKVYKKRLEELKSPLLEVFEQEETPDTILRDRSYYVIEDPQEMITWVDDQVKASAGGVRVQEATTA